MVDAAAFVAALVGLGVRAVLGDVSVLVAVVADHGRSHAVACQVSSCNQSATDVVNPPASKSTTL